MNKSIDICTKVIYNKDNSKSPLCILRNYTRAKLQGSKTNVHYIPPKHLNYTRAKLQGSKTGVSAERYSHLNYTRAKLQGCSFIRKKSRTLCTFASGTACYSYIKLYQNEKTPGENSPGVAIYIRTLCYLLLRQG